ncbi:hypothetical protein IWQ61_010405, partial [Dispira simplex]
MYKASENSKLYKWREKNRSLWGDILQAIAKLNVAVDAYERISHQRSQNCFVKPHRAKKLKLRQENNCQEFDKELEQIHLDIRSGKDDIFHRLRVNDGLNCNLIYRIYDTAKSTEYLGTNNWKQLDKLAQKTDDFFKKVKVNDMVDLIHLIPLSDLDDPEQCFLYFLLICILRMSNQDDFYEILSVANLWATRNWREDLVCVADIENIFELMHYTLILDT